MKLKAYSQYILGTVGALSLIVIVFFTSIEVPVFNRFFFAHEYKKNSVAENTGIDEDEFKAVTVCIMDYLRGRRDDLVVFAHVDGVYKEVFNEREKQHMVDVQNLFLAAYKIRGIAVALFLLTLILLLFMKADLRKVFIKCFTALSIVLLITAVFLAVLISTDFEKYFTIFHEIFFSNELWILDPDTDLLINIVPLGFFIDISIFIGSLFVMLMSVITAGTILSKGKK